MARDKKWIQKAIDHKKKGSLRKALGVKEGEKIPASKLKKAAAGKGVGSKTKKRAQLAKTLRKFK